ncbi:putative bromodomain associated protein [Blumeria hordei DH14]|uniref:Transcription initiation factor TFIID subunit 8 n=1 Tax=Blumeria graminis f. sp. hordei (strain DH14) TaxID=546991 RepID=N1JAN2_BLUG1|nr:putative bromodomain associated protein [Blumeria hordei DH14]
MAPLSPTIPRKRTSPSDHYNSSEPVPKRIGLELATQSSSVSLGQCSSPKMVPVMFDDDPHNLLLRSITLALQHVGFSAATPEALEAICDGVETYALRFLSKVTESMLCSRRSQPIPTDFAFALKEFDVPLLSIEPHLKPPIPLSKTQVRLEELTSEKLPVQTDNILLGDELSGDMDKRERPYIPKNFPSFPSKHTYKWTEKESARESDPRKIREEAAKVARQGEEALRRLTKVGKIGKEKDAKKIASRDPRSKERHQIWESVMKSLVSWNKTSSSMSELSSGTDEESRSMIVNAERPYFRKGPPARKKRAPSTDIYESLKV